MLKNLGTKLLVAFLVFCLLATAFLTATNSVFGTPDALKESLAKSNVYTSVAAGLVEQAKKSAQEPQKGDVQLDAKVVEQVATKVITPEKLQGYSEQVVDGTYNWLEGETEQPDFNLDVVSIKNDLGNSVGDTAVARVQGLPACTYAQLQKLSTQEINPFTLPCRPPGINLKAERAKLVNEITKSDDVLEDTKITAADLKSPETGQSPFEQLSVIPTIFQWSKFGPWILGVLAVATGAAIVFWHDERRRGIKKIAITMLVAGALLLVAIWLTNFAFDSINFTQPGADNQHFADAAVGAMKTLSAVFDSVLLYFAIVYAAVGAGGLIWLRVSKPQTAPAQKPKR